MWTQLSRAARAGIVFLTRVSEGTLGLVDYHCKAPFRSAIVFSCPGGAFFKAIKRCGKQLQQPQQKQRKQQPK